jgi:fatty-acyl-CoA synthase
MSRFANRPIRNLADIIAFENEKPFEQRLAAKSVYDVFTESAALYADRTAVSILQRGDPDEAENFITYAQLLSGVNRAANLFTELGGSGAGVAYLLPNLLDTFYVLWGAESAGYAVPINFLLGAEHIADIVRTSRAKILVALGPHPSLNIWEKAVDVAKSIPGLQLLQVPAGTAPTPGAKCLDALMLEQDGAAQKFKPTNQPDDVAAYYHTGGTTGAPKLVAHSHRNQLVAALGGAVLLDYSEKDVLNYALPMFHVAANISLGLSALMCGTKLLIPSPLGFREPNVIKNMWRLAEKYKLTRLGGVPAALSAMLNVPVDADISSARVSVAGAASTPEIVAERYEAHTGTHLHEIYGMTEAGGIIAIDPVNGTRVRGSVGYRLPYTGLKVHRLKSSEELGDECAPNEVGVLVISGPTVSPGYIGAAANQDAIASGVLNTGDLAILDESGRLSITGRAKDLIIRSGHNIDPRMIEDALQSHAQVALAASVGQPDRYAGEVPVCYVMLKPNSTVTIEELRTVAEQRIAERPAWPRQIYIVDSIPMTGVGKVFKVDLRLDAARRLVSNMLADAIGTNAATSIQVQNGGRKGMTVRVALAPEAREKRPLAQAALEGFLFDVDVS